MHHPVMGFEHLHRHSDYSLLDGYATIEDYAHRMKDINQKYLCITDHGVLGAVPQQISVSDKFGLNPIFGCELYVNAMQPEVQTRAESAAFRKDLDPDQQKRFDKTCHLLAIAYNLQGYSNLVHLTSWAWIHGFYKKPRVNHDVLNKHKEGIIFTSGCANSEIAVALSRQGEDAAFAVLEKYIAMFGEHFYLEIMMLDFKDQKPYDVFLLKAHLKYGIPLVLTQDCHYCKKEESFNQSLMIMQQTKRTLAELEALKKSDSAADLFELQDQNLWLKSEDELNEFWEAKYQDTIDYELFKIAKANTIKICEFAKGVQLDRSLKLPRFPNDDRLLRDAVEEGFKGRACPDTKRYWDRIEEEYGLICEKEFASYFLIQKMMVDEARRVGPQLLGFGDGSECVGPGRGSICGSLVAYCIGLHDVDPIIHDLKFSRFLSPARGGKQMKIKYTVQPVKRGKVA